MLDHHNYTSNMFECHLKRVQLEMCNNHMLYLKHYILALDTMSKEAVNALMSKSSGYLIMYTPAAMSAEAQAVREGVIASFFAAKTQTAIFSRGPISVRRIQGPSGATSTISPSGLNPL